MYKCIWLAVEWGMVSAHSVNTPTACVSWENVLIFHHFEVSCYIYCCKKKNSLSNLAGVLSRLFSVCVKRIRIFVRFYKVFNAITIHSQLQHILPRSAEIPHWPCQIRTELYYLGRMYLFIYDSQCIGYFIVQVLKLLWLAGCAYTIHWEAIPSGCTNPALSNIIMTLQSIYLV